LIKVVSLSPRVEYITPEEMRAAEALAASRGIGESVLMENAGSAVARLIDARFGHPAGREVLIVCGLGNNGGDGLVAARALGGRWRVRVLLLGSAGDIKTGTSAGNWSLLGPSIERFEASDAASVLGRAEWFSSADVIVDAVMGTGVRGEVREPQATAIRSINSAAGAKVAIDIPSGLDPLTGEAASCTVRADLTVALHRAKTGLRGKGAYTGEVVEADIGIVE
jgi:hydroxyethylthiazole kinase-like uncharacterized protein yjeF